jgi:RTX calcium-binding nonapeptide repeat (4 copies)
MGRQPTLVGTPRGETLAGTSGADVILGLGGRDITKGLKGDDVICGGEGDDLVLGGSGYISRRGASLPRKWLAVEAGPHPSRERHAGGVCKPTPPLELT